MAKTSLRLSQARHDDVEMVRLMKNEKLYPESKAHLSKEWMDTDASRFRLGQPLDELDDCPPEGFKANEYFLCG